jgi:hypothetical protein
MWFVNVCVNVNKCFSYIICSLTLVKFSEYFVLCNNISPLRKIMRFYFQFISCVKIGTAVWFLDNVIVAI